MCACMYVCMSEAGWERQWWSKATPITNCVQEKACETRKREKEEEKEHQQEQEQNRNQKQEIEAKG